MVLPKALGKNLPCLSQLPVVVSSPWHSLACGHIAPVSASVFTWPSPLCVYVSSHSLLIRTSVTGCRVYLYTTYYVCKDSLSKQSHVLKFWMNSDFMGAQWTPQQTLPKEHFTNKAQTNKLSVQSVFPKKHDLGENLTITICSIEWVQDGDPGRRCCCYRFGEPNNPSALFSSSLRLESTSHPHSSCGMKPLLVPLPSACS